MRAIKRTLASVFSIALFAIVSNSTATAADADVIQKLQDRIEISELLNRYAAALDTLDPDAYAAVFTDDGEMVMGDQVSKGQAGIKKLIMGFRTTREQRKAKGEIIQPMYHVITNSTIEFTDATHARHTSYYMTVFGASGTEKPANVAAAGHSLDVVVKQNGKWLIQSRKLLAPR